MTSTPVTVGKVPVYAGKAQTAASQPGAGMENSFSDVLKNQQGSADVKGTESPVCKKTDAKIDKVSDGSVKAAKNVKKTADTENSAEVSPEEAVLQAEKAAEAAAAEMVTQTAEELGITEEEVLQILDGLGMSPMDLLNTENLQMVVLAAAGETDMSSFVTDEQLFTSFKNLTATLEEAIAEVSEETGLSTQEVEELFAGLQEKAQTETVEETGLPMVEAKKPLMQEQSVDGNLKPEAISGREDNVGEGSQVMLERSLEQTKAGNGSENSFSGEEAPNPFVPNPVSQNAAAALETVQEAQAFFDADTEMIMHQITDYMKAQVSDGVSELEMQLHPESLGNLHIRLTAKEGVITAHFAAQNDVVKTALESQMIQLKETFKEQGVKVEAIEVTVESHKFDENLSQNSGGNMNGENRQPTRQRNRRISINLNELEMEEDTLTQEDKLAAQVLKDNGGTVEYTA